MTRFARNQKQTPALAMRALRGNIHTTTRLTVVAVFVVATILTAGLASALQYYFGQPIARGTAAKLYASAASSIALEECAGPGSSPPTSSLC